ncbi:tetratricopeptide repeat protein [Caproiciproducens sp. CPB-2]|uniref:tetratricopeptide repeat protein n=1 Tax=Caproiciproducens sp. CPB-2 TaxID=3030017 RepID=UPI0023DB844E|nr:tetratricopeptide repeat protein [Caproiciproducens sp. CPB-2]MDF1495809.1 tetratricopeptide repeat protein [Caproiciproducens sp. CPB-2]
MAQGDKSLNSKDYSNAIAFYNEAISTDGSKEADYLGLANCYIAQQDYTSAEKILSDGYTATENSAIAAKQKAVISENEISLLKKFAATLPKNRQAPSDVTGEAGDGNDLVNYFIAEEDGKIVLSGLDLRGAIIIDTNGDGHYELIADYVNGYNFNIRKRLLLSGLN